MNICMNISERNLGAPDEAEAPPGKGERDQGGS